MDLFKFMKNWTLPLAMLAGVIGYFVFANFTFLEPTKPFMNGLISFLTPSLIFAQLLLTFCKIEPKELVPRVWHGWLLAIQAISCGIIALLLIFCPMDESYKDLTPEVGSINIFFPFAAFTALPLHQFKLKSVEIQTDGIYFGLRYRLIGNLFVVWIVK